MLGRCPGCGRETAHCACIKASIFKAKRCPVCGQPKPCWCPKHGD